MDPAPVRLRTNRTTVLLAILLQMESEPALMLGPLGSAPSEWDDDTPQPTPGELMDMLRPHLVAATHTSGSPDQLVTLGQLLPNLHQADLSQMLDAAKVTNELILIIITRHCTGPSVPITARVHSTLQRPFPFSQKRRGPRQGWSTGHKAPRLLTLCPVPHSLPLLSPWALLSD